MQPLLIIFTYKMPRLIYILYVVPATTSLRQSTRLACTFMIFSLYTSVNCPGTVFRIFLYEASDSNCIFVYTVLVIFVFTIVVRKYQQVAMLLHCYTPNTDSSEKSLSTSGLYTIWPLISRYYSQAFPVKIRFLVYRNGLRVKTLNILPPPAGHPSICRMPYNRPICAIHSIL